MDKKTIIFDFDGTIANTYDTIIDLYNGIAPKYNCLIVPKEKRVPIKDYRPQDVFNDFGISRFKLPFLVYEVRKALRREIVNVPPCSGMIKAIKEIKASGYNLGIMTSNSKKNVQLFLKKHNIDSLFDFIYSGRNLFNKVGVLKKLLRKENIKKIDAIYVGDETRDIEATQNIGITMIAVSWGFNSSTALNKLQPDALVKSSEELIDTVTKC